MMRLTPTQGELLRLLAGRDRLHKAHGAGTWTLPGRYGRWAEATVQPLLNDGLLAGDGIDENAQYLAITDRGRAAVPAGSAAGIGGQIAVHCAVDGTLFTNMTVAIGSVFWLGTVATLPSFELNPQAMLNLLEVVYVNVTPDLKGRVQSYELGVKKFTDQIPVT